jgi:iron complex outermembrane recepter protein
MTPRGSLFVSSSLAGLLLAGAAQAQEAAPANTIEELVVTAEKREQSLQDVPVAISAFTSEQRELIGINTVQDMSNMTPGLNYSSQLDRISLRGVGRLTNVQAADPAVAVYSDGVYTSSTVEAGRTPLFLDRVEILRGPQGTLYGRNGIGGSINVISKRPTEDFYAEVRATLANYERTLLEAAMSGPLAEGLRFRLAGNWEKQREGYFHNVVPGMPEEGNVIDQVYFEGQLEFEIGENLEGWLKIAIADWNNGSGGPGARASYTNGAYNTTQFVPGVFLLNAGYAFSGRPTGVINAGPTTNPALGDVRAFATDTAETISLDRTVIMQTHWTYHLDGMDLKYVGGATNYHYTLIQDNDGTAVSRYTLPLNPPSAAAVCNFVPGCAPLTIFPKRISNYQEDKHWFSHEVTLSSTTDSPFQWLAGAFYYHEGYKQPVFVIAPDQPQLATTANGPINPTRRWYDTVPAHEDKSWAGFGQIDWEFAEGWKTTIGLRYSKDHKFGVETARLVCFALATCSTVPENLGTLTPAIDLTGVGGVSSGRDAAGNLLPGVSFATIIEPSTGIARRGLDAKWDAWTGTAGLQWSPDDDTMAYARYSRGYKAGGFNSGIVAPLVAFPYTDKETVIA